MIRTSLVFIGLASALAISACSKKEEPTGPVKRLAGSWKTDISISKLEAPGAPPEAKTQMEGMMKAMSAIEVCLTPAQAAKEESIESLMKGQSQQDCTFAKKEISGAAINVEGVCKQGGQDVNMKITGTRDPKKTDAVVQISGKTPQGAVAMDMRAVSTWTGECKPGQMTTDGKPQA